MGWRAKTSFKLAILLFGVSILSGCSNWFASATTSYDSGYLPLGPMSICYKNPPDTMIKKGHKGDRLLCYFPDTAMRMGVYESSGSANGTYGTVKLGTEGHSYTVVLDYTQSTTLQLSLHVDKSEELDPEKITDRKVKAALLSKLDHGMHPGWKFDVPDDMKFATDTNKSITKPTDLVIPVYVGVGCRLRADITVVKGSVDLSSLATIGAAVSAGKATGTLSLQVIGINGQAINSSLTIPQKIDDTTIQNTLMSVGVVKAKTYDDATEIAPRIIGIESPFPLTGEQRAQIISLLLRSQYIQLPVICEEGDTRAVRATTTDNTASAAGMTPATTTTEISTTRPIVVMLTAATQPSTTQPTTQSTTRPNIPPNFENIATVLKDWGVEAKVVDSDEAKASGPDMTAMQQNNSGRMAK